VEKSFDLEKGSKLPRIDFAKILCNSNFTGRERERKKERERDRGRECAQCLCSLERGMREGARGGERERVCVYEREKDK
jgi:hypothetical protein